MIKKTLEYYVIEKEDLEKAVSEYFEKDVKLSDMDCIFTDRITVDDEVGAGMSFEICVDGDSVHYDELYLAEDFLIMMGETDIYGKRETVFRMRETFVDEKDLFGFDVKCFKSYERYTDAWDW